MNLVPGKQRAIALATSDHASDLIGIVANQPLVELGSNTRETQVVVSGETTALVSDVNGTIKVGDKVTASPIQGVGMKALTSTEVVGTAESELTPGSTTSRTITDKTGHAKTVHIGQINVQVNVSYYAVSSGTLSTVVPSFLLSAGNAIAGKDVSPLRVLVGFTCLLLGFIVAGVVLQAAVRAGIISLGRNPLAHSLLRQGMLDVLGTTLGLLVLTAIVFYLILTI